MANKKLVLLGALGATVLLALFLFTREGVQPDGKPQRASSSHAVGQKVAVARKVNRKARKGNRAQRRAAFLKKWEKMTPEQREAFKKKHPNAKVPPDTPPAPATGTAVKTAPKIAPKTVPKVAPTTAPKVAPKTAPKTP